MMRVKVKLNPLNPGVPWQCFNCGECCKNISISKQEYNLIFKNIPLKTQRRFKMVVEPHIERPSFLKIKGNCLFYSKPKKRCLIYKIRPYPCRYFMCGRQSKEERFISHNGGCINLRYRIQSDATFRDQYGKAFQESKQWALKHGWNKEDFD